MQCSNLCGFEVTCPFLVIDLFFATILPERIISYTNDIIFLLPVYSFWNCFFLKIVSLLNIFLIKNERCSIYMTSSWQKSILSIIALDHGTTFWVGRTKIDFSANFVYHERYCIFTILILVSCLELPLDALKSGTIMLILRNAKTHSQ